MTTRTLANLANIVNAHTHFDDVYMVATKGECEWWWLNKHGYITIDPKTTVTRPTNKGMDFIHDCCKVLLPTPRAVQHEPGNSG